MSSHMLPPEYETEAFGPDTLCNITSCPIEWAVIGYRPSLAANVIFAVLFGLVGIVHAYLGFRWKSWGFMIGMLLGCITEIIGYSGRILMYDNPFSFIGFMIQIICLTFAPVFYTASIYVTLSKTIIFFAPELSRFKPQLFYWIFIPLDIVCLILQSAGGALSTEDDSQQLGIDISMAGLALQVIVLVAFIGAFADYMWRYLRSGLAVQFNWRVKAFFAGLSIATILILVRCIYRVVELKDGYDGELITHEIPFIILEGVVIFIAATCLCFGHPGLLFSKDRGYLSTDAEKTVPGSSESNDGGEDSSYPLRGVNLSGNGNSYDSNYHLRDTN